MTKILNKMHVYFEACPTHQVNYRLNAEAIRNLNKEESAVYKIFFLKMYQVHIQAKRHMYIHYRVASLLKSHYLSR